jgi:NADH-quinone oxidoreductase subunit N
MFNFEFILTEVFISLSLLVLLLVASFVFKEYSLSTSKTSVRFNESYFATLSFILFLAFLVSVSSFNLYFDNSVFVFGGALKKNATITIFQSLILFFGSFITFTCRHFTINNSRFEFSILVGFVILGMLFLACSNDFISLYLAIEIQGLSAYILTSYLTFSAYSTEAGLKYFVLGSLSSGIMLFGFALIYAVTGSTCFSDIQTFLLFSSNSSVLTSMADQILFVCFLFSLVGLFFKIGSFPFQWYLPDVYEGAPVFSAAFFAVVTKAGVIAILATLLFDVLYVIQSKFTLFFIVSIAGSFITGILGAFFQQNIRRFFAYSSITHVSFFIISLLCFESGGVEVLVTYLAIYMFTSLAV